MKCFTFVPSSVSWFQLMNSQILSVAQNKEEKRKLARLREPVLGWVHLLLGVTRPCKVNAFQGQFQPPELSLPSPTQNAFSKDRGDHTTKFPASSSQACQDKPTDIPQMGGLCREGSKDQVRSKEGLGGMHRTLDPVLPSFTFPRQKRGE